MIICGILSRVIVRVLGHAKMDGYLDSKNLLCKKHLFCELGLTCEDKILNTIEVSCDVKKNNMQKVIAPIHIFIGNCLLIISCHFSVFIFIIQNIDQNRNNYYHFTTPTIN